MFYEFAIAVAANTAESAPVTQDLHLEHGIIIGIDIQFPIGCFGLAHCRLEHHSFGSLPANRSTSFATDGYIIHIDTPLEFYVEPYQVKAILWNDDDTYAHTVTIRFDIAQQKAYIWFMSLLKGLEKFLRLTGIKV